jgi:hypothetical protein
MGLFMSREDKLERAFGYVVTLLFMCGMAINEPQFGHLISGTTTDERMQDAIRKLDVLFASDPAMIAKVRRQWAYLDSELPGMGGLLPGLLLQHMDAHDGKADGWEPNYRSIRAAHARTRHGVDSTYVGG